MKKRLSRVSPLQFGVVMAVFNGLLTLVICLPMGLLFSLFSAVTVSSGTQANVIAPGGPGLFMGGFMAFFLPVIYAVLGFIGGVIAAAIYNLIAKLTGGIEVTVEDAPEA